MRRPHSRFPEAAPCTRRVVIKPYLISRGGSLPLLLVFMGVLGGLLAFGFIGVFLGPVILAVGYALLSEWMRPAAAPEKLSETSTG